jgi:glutathionyl-hydroquinone reductase
MTTAQFPDEEVDGAFERQADAFANWVRADGSTDFPAVAGRYHLYVSLACPWAHRTIIVRALKKLEDAIGMTVVDPIRDDRGWAFHDGPGMGPDPVNGFRFLAEAYAQTDPTYRGRVTVPVLWDKQSERIVSNNDDHIMRMLEVEFDGVAGSHDLDFYPEAHRSQIDALNDEIYESVNNGVYRAGFATEQDAYATAAQSVFNELDRLEARLSRTRFLFGTTPAETDWRLFVTLIRFDAVYVGHFKCNLRRIYDYPNLWGYLRDLYQFRNVASTVNFDHIKRHYYMTHDEINPTRIVPIGPLLDLTSAHDRAGMS